MYNNEKSEKNQELELFHRDYDGNGDDVNNSNLVSDTLFNNK